MVLVTLSYVSDRADDLITKFDGSLFEIDFELLNEEEEDEQINEREIWHGLGWIVGGLLAFYLLGFILSTFLLVFLFMVTRGEHTKREAGAVATGTTIFMYILFVAVFNLILPPGVIIELLLSPIAS